MNIESRLVELNLSAPFDNNDIESELKNMGINPLRWAIVKVDCNKITISLACENL